MDLGFSLTDLGFGLKDPRNFSDIIPLNWGPGPAPVRIEYEMKGMTLCLAVADASTPISLN